MAAPPDPIRIFRLMHLDNLAVCLQDNGLYAPNKIPLDGSTYKTIHDIDIQNVRQSRCVICGPQGTIHDYVAFYFGMRSPMLYKLYKGQVDDYYEGQEPLIYLVSTVQAINNAGLQFVFSDGHGIAAFTKWYDDLDSLKEIDWDTVYADYWRDTDDDLDRQRRKQAEFLVYSFCPWELVHEIGVINTAAMDRVSKILSNYADSTPVKIRENWYY